MLGRRKGWLRRLLTFSAPDPPVDAFLPIDAMVSGMSHGARRIGRAEALGIPAVLRGRNMIASIATLPLVQHGPRGSVVRNPLLEQIDPDVANVVTLAQTLEDLLFEGIAWWRVTAQDAPGFPVSGRHLEVSSVSVDPPADRAPSPMPSGVDPRDMFVWVGGVRVPASTVIRFDSPNPGVLKTCGNAIRRAVLLDAAASLYADDPRPLDYFTPSEGADEVDDAEIRVILAEWRAARKARSTGWIPRAMEYNSVASPSPQQLQLVELQKQAGLDVANALGIDPEDLGISTTSRTYANAVDRRRDRINDVLSPYMQAITQRLTMGDVTRRGHTVLFDVDDYMRANPTERVAYYKGMQEVAGMTEEEVRAEERMSPLSEPSIQDSVAAVPAYFDAEEPLRFVDVPVVGAFRVDSTRRTITGAAVPYGPVASKYGFKYRFLRGSLQWNERAPGRVKMLRDHDVGNPIGFAKSLAHAGAQFQVTFKIARGAKGDEALTLAEDGVLDGLSVGVDFDMADDVEMDDDGVMNIRRATLREVSLTAMPAFDDARVSKVAASRDKGGHQMDPCETCGRTHTEAAGCAPSPNQPAASAALALNADQISALLAHPDALTALMRPAAASAPAAPTGSLTLSRDQLDAIIASGGLPTLLGVPRVTPPPDPERPAVVDPTRREAAQTSVSEPLPYRFDSEGNLTRGTQYDFSTDLVAGSKGDTEAMARASSFVRAQAAAFTGVEFDVDRADVAGLRPNTPRPDLYVDQKEYTYPMWLAVSKGTLVDMTPFVLPRFASATGLVGPHVEGVEPTPGTFVASAQTITPSAVSGKVEVTREAWDQGGNPQLSGILWRQMTRAWFEALEASVVTLLDSLTPTAITLPVAAADDVLVDALDAAIAELQFVRGGMRMRELFLQVNLYKGLIAATDADGRKLLPLLGAVNANGQVSELYADVNVGGLRGRPGWALAASGAVAASSYLFDRNDVHGWATAPERLEFQYRVAFVDVAIWGYKALANTDITGVREIIYDPTA